MLIYLILFCFSGDEKGRHDQQKHGSPGPGREGCTGSQ